MASPVFETFEIELQNTLHHLYEPFYRPEICIFEVLDLPASADMETVRKQIIDAIEVMGHGAGIPETAKIIILYRVLFYRFVNSQSQEKAAEALEISPRHFRRKQNEAIHALAMQLWKEYQETDRQEKQADEPGDANQNPRTRTEDETSGETWVDPILAEIAVLNQRSSGMNSDLGKVIQRTIEMARHLLIPSSISLDVAPISEGIEVPIHPNVLRQVFLFVFQQMVDSGYTGPLQLQVRGESDSNVIAFISCSDKAGHIFDVQRIQELAAILGGKVVFLQEEKSCSLELIFPKSKKRKVLVVDDNVDVERLYNQFSANTRYQVFYSSSGVDLKDQISKIQPDVLIIDVLLPGLDGWDLLLQLRNDQETAGLPVIVSSVMGNPEIARSLGASGYLPKPVDRKGLLQALDAVD